MKDSSIRDSQDDSEKHPEKVSTHHPQGRSHHLAESSYWERTGLDRVRGRSVTQGKSYISLLENSYPVNEKRGVG